MENQQRYERQTILPDFGVRGQEMLASASVLVIGAGGLGCPVLQYLCAAGVGSIAVMDDDVVEWSNLARQVLYTEEHLGLYKADVAVSLMKRMNSMVRAEALREKLSKENAFDLIERHRLVIDCTDNFPTRYLVNDVCVVMGKPLVFGAVSGFEGQVALFNVNGSGNYRDLFPQMPLPGEVLNCAEAGVLGVLPGIIGTMMALEAVKHIAGVGDTLVNRLLTYDGKRGNMMTVAYQPVGMPITREQVLSTDYSGGCDVSWRVELADLKYFLDDGSLIVDVRAYHEQPHAAGFPHERVPLPELGPRLPGWRGRRVLFFCASGQRSSAAAIHARAAGVEAFSLAGFPNHLQGRHFQGADLGGPCA